MTSSHINAANSRHAASAAATAAAANSNKQRYHNASSDVTAATSQSAADEGDERESDPLIPRCSDTTSAPPPSRRKHDTTQRNPNKIGSLYKCYITPLPSGSIKSMDSKYGAQFYRDACFDDDSSDDCDKNDSSSSRRNDDVTQPDEAKETDNLLLTPESEEKSYITSYITSLAQGKRINPFAFDEAPANDSLPPASDDVKSTQNDATGGYDKLPSSVDSSGTAAGENERFLDGVWQTGLPGNAATEYELRAGG